MAVRRGRSPCRRRSRSSCAAAEACTSGIPATTRSPDWPAYNDIIGIGWRKKEFGWALVVSDDGTITKIPPGQGENTGHGKRFDALVQRLGEHPIHRGLPRAWLAADIEVYYYVRGPAKNVDVLSYAHEPHTALNWPIEWTVRYGRGRVYTSTLGHVWRGDVQPVTVRDAGVQTLLVRALQWLARAAGHLAGARGFSDSDIDLDSRRVAVAGLTFVLASQSRTVLYG